MCSDTKWIPGSSAKACECRRAGCLICEVEGLSGKAVAVPHVAPPRLRYSLRRISDDRDMVWVSSLDVAWAVAAGSDGKWYIWDRSKGLPACLKGYELGGCECVECSKGEVA